MSSIKTLTFFITVCCCATLVNATEMKRLETVKQEFQSSGDLTRLEYAFVRCSSIQMALGALMLKNGAKDAADRFQSSALGYLQAASIIHDDTNKQRGVKEDDSLGALTKSSQMIVRLYVERMGKNWAISGDYFTSDEQLVKELDLCKDQGKFIDWMTN